MRALAKATTEATPNDYKMLELRAIRSKLETDAQSSYELSALFDSAEKAGQGQAPTAGDFASSLESLARGLEAERRTLAAWAPDEPKAAAPKATAPRAASRGARSAAPGPDQPPSEKAAEDEPLTRDESAILARLTEKYYQSWAFRIVGFALVAAAFLAGGGTLFLGDKTLNVKEELENAQKKAEDEIKNVNKGLEESIDKQLKALTTASAEIQAKKDNFEHDLNDGKDANRRH